MNISDRMDFDRDVLDDLNKLIRFFSDDLGYCEHSLDDNIYHDCNKDVIDIYYNHLVNLYEEFKEKW